MRFLQKFYFAFVASTLFCQCENLEEKVGQMLVAHFYGNECNENAKVLIDEIHVGGIIYYEWANHLESKSQVANLSRSLQEHAKIPLFIMVDQEGGRVSRLKTDFTPIPSPMDIAKSNDPLMAKHYATIIAKELLDVGVNFNLAPVVDIAFSNRSYGKDLKTVLAFAKNALKGYQENGLLTCLKHFPGHGATKLDSHFTLPVVEKSLEELMKHELVPFFNLQADAIMTAHILLPEIDLNRCATLSPKILSLLRDRYEGLIISDSLAMQGVLDNSSDPDTAAIEAILAGVDVIILGGSQLIGQNITTEFSLEDFKRIHESIVNAVKQGKIPTERIDQSIERIFRVKAKLRQKN